MFPNSATRSSVLRALTPKRLGVYELTPSAFEPTSVQSLSVAKLDTMPNNYLQALREIAERRERFNEWTRRLHSERAVPTSLPLVLREGSGDTELEDYLAEGQAMLAGESAFFEKYGRMEDPHAAED